MRWANLLFILGLPLVAVDLPTRRAVPWNDLLPDMLRAVLVLASAWQFQLMRVDSRFRTRRTLAFIAAWALVLVSLIPFLAEELTNAIGWITHFEPVIVLIVLLTHAATIAVWAHVMDLRHARAAWNATYWLTILACCSAALFILCEFLGIRAIRYDPKNAVSVLAWWVTIAIVVTLILVLLTAAFELDRAVRAVLNGRRHVPTPATCAECDYDLRGLSESRCPECGTPFSGPAPQAVQ